MFQIAIKDVALKLAAEQLAGKIESYALIGGLAVSWHAEPRSTADIDFAIRISPGQHQALALSLNANYREGDHGDPLHSVFSFDSSGISVQLVQLPDRST